MRFNSKGLTTLAMLAMMAFYSSSQAKAFENANGFAQLGSGIENKKTGEIIALACTEIDTADHNCKTAQFLYFSNRYSEPKTIGHIFELDQKQVKALAGELQKSFAKYRAEKHEFVKPVTTAYAAGLTVLTPILLFTGVLGPSAFAVYLGGSFAVMGLILLKEVHGKPIVGSLIPAVDLQFSQNGWNWAEEPNKLRAHQFESFKNYLEVYHD